MTPRTPATVTPVQEIQEINIADLRIAPWNARKTFDLGALEGMVASIREHGIVQRLLVRPLGNAWEIVAGELRYHASVILAAKEDDDRFAWLPCSVRELTDDQAREIALVDNLQPGMGRAALEEADAYAELQQRLGTPAAIALRVGKDVSYVTRRLQLVSLAAAPRKALAERLIAIDHALLFARLGDAEQDVNLKWCLNTNAGAKETVESVIAERIKQRDRKDRWAPWEPESPLSLRNHIEDHVGRKLKRAPWPLDDVELFPEAGACSGCPSNTDANVSLFGDLDIDEATCEKGACYEHKRDLYVQIQLSVACASPKAKPEMGPAIRCSWKSTSVKPRGSKPKAGMEFEDDGFSLFQIFKAGQWVEAKAKSCEHIRLGVTVDWSDADERGRMGGSGGKLRKPGQTLTVCIAEKCKAHPKTWERAKAQTHQERRDPQKEAQEKQESSAAAIAESKLRVAVISAALDGVTKIPAAALRTILLNAVPTWGHAVRVIEAIIPGIEKTLKNSKADSPEFAKAVALLSLDHQALFCGDWQPADTYRKELLSSLRAIGYDGSKAWEKPAAEKPAAKAAPAKAAAKKAAKKGGRK